jgi:hypothetical protein
VGEKETFNLVHYTFWLFMISPRIFGGLGFKKAAKFYGTNATLEENLINAQMMR